MELSFEKLHGNGNDFILVDEFSRTIIPDEMKARFAELYCDRRFGIGGDGVLYLSRTAQADLRMRLFQPDGSEASMCGNGIRCFAKHAFDAGYVEKTCTVETLAGSVTVEMGYEDETFMATIGMPAPRFNRPDIPVSGEGEFRETLLGYEVFAVNTGVPHAVIFTEDLDSFPLTEIGPKIRSHELFSEGTNVNIVKNEGGDLLRIRTYERGVEDETYSCGTGATASAAVAQHLGYTGSKVRVETLGGPLVIILGERTLMEGPAESVFRGVITF